MKYQEWQVASADRAAIARLEAGGFSPLTAAVLCSRGYTSPEEAGVFLSAASPLLDPYLLRDMDKLVERVCSALEQHEKIAVFGDYDVDGITATTLLTHFLRKQGADCVPYIPSRLEEGYGLNAMALSSLRDAGVKLIITVDCGITAVEEALLCREYGIDLCITDHHECKDTLPDCLAVVDPHRRDHTYPHQMLSGVGVAFKVAAAICFDQQAVLDEYSDLVCLGTIADVMPLLGENRVFVRRGLELLQKPKRAGIRALIQEAGCGERSVTAGTAGYALAPRINAAGRMGCVNVALDLFLSENDEEASALAQQLCQLNRQRQSVESAIYREAVSMLPAKGKPGAIVLSNENWHQGVVGIVASRLAEEYCCPTFLICPDGEKGKASSRSYGGFNLFAALETLSPLLESYGGHALAAGFTIRLDNIDRFREEITRLAGEFVQSGEAKQALEIDCEVPLAKLTVENVTALDELEPCGTGCPRPVFCLSDVKIDQLSEVGNGKHLRLHVTDGKQGLSAIFFSTTALRASVTLGDRVDLAFNPQINEFRGTKSVQLNLIDIRPALRERNLITSDLALYNHFTNHTLSPAEASDLIPSRQEFAILWRYLAAHCEQDCMTDTVECLARKVSQTGPIPCRPCRTRICLEVFRELGLITLLEHQHIFKITMTAHGKKVDLDKSQILSDLNRQKAGER